MNQSTGLFGAKYIFISLRTQLFTSCFLFAFQKNKRVLQLPEKCLIRTLCLFELSVSFRPLANRECTFWVKHLCEKKYVLLADTAGRGLGLNLHGDSSVHQDSLAKSISRTSCIQ
jgi:hypothetical protein